MDYLFKSFVVNKIDDNVVPKVDNAKLNEIGLAYGDIVSYHQFFPDNKDTTMFSYRQRAEELKNKLKRTHS